MGEFRRKGLGGGFLICQCGAIQADLSAGKYKLKYVFTFQYGTIQTLSTVRTELSVLFTFQYGTIQTI